MDPQHPIYPHRLPTKRRWADLTQLGAFGGCTEYNVAGKRRDHITLVAEDSELRIQNSGLGTQNSGLRSVRFFT